MGRSRITLARYASQAAFLGLFLWLFLSTESTGQDTLGPPVRLFLDFDPLIFLSTVLAAHAAPAAFFLSLITLGLTAVLGRAFCGWVCPLGTLHNVASRFKRRTARPLGVHWLKYLVLFFVLGAAVFGAELAGWLDPISLLIRSLAVGVYPAFAYGTEAFFGAMYAADLGVLTDASEAVYAVARDTVLPFRAPHYYQGWLMTGLFVLVLVLNLYERRSWCRYICPLGALLGLVGRYAPLKRSVAEGCTECGACARGCHGAATPHVKGSFRPGECYLCNSCDDVCPEGAVRYTFGARHAFAPMDLGRRRVLASIAAGAATVPVLRAGASSVAPNPLLIRPPGSLAEAEFLGRCVRCGQCMKVCITGGLQPAFMQAGLEGLWTPVLVPRVGYCEYRCTLCGQVCPTGAIERLTLERKLKTSIGLAMVDLSRCLPHAHARPCIVCEEVCPTSPKAVVLEEKVMTAPDGAQVRLRQPRVDLEKCIGCGICEAECPVTGTPAITVTTLGETRHPENRLLI